MKHSFCRFRRGAFAIAAFVSAIFAQSLFSTSAIAQTDGKTPWGTVVAAPDGTL